MLHQMLPISNKFVCVCEKYGLGRPHSVSKSTWYQHLQQASTEEEKTRMRVAEALHTYDNTVQDLSLPEQRDDQSVASGSSLPPSSRRAAAIQTLAKRARENQDTRHVGRRKCAQTTSMDQSQSNQQNHCSDNMDITMGDDFDNLIDDVCMPSNNFANPNEPPDDFADQNEPPIPDNNQHIPPDDFADRNEPPVPDNNPHIPPDDFADQNEPPVPNNAPEGDGHQQEYQFVLHRQPRPNIDVEALAQMAVLPKMKETMDYILTLNNASLEDPIAKLDDTALERLRNPPQEPVVIDSPSIRHSISSYLALEHASQEAYNRIQRSTKLNFAGAADVDDILSFYNVEKLIAQYTGVESPSRA
ncbi:hypothetical protein F4604DRAFT_1919966 [Suillus subluteus]|nr:hypothetical protein F4604DRAFT_1919966 [Suillus subluteus]